MTDHGLASSERPEKIFVSSTVMDLIDIRAEVAVLLADMSFHVYQSDVINEHWIAGKGTTAIETCLVNVENADFFLLIISERYGGRLGNAYQNLSATHLEYRRARELGIPTMILVRDSTEARFKQWSHNGGKPDDLSSDEQEIGLFDFIAEVLDDKSGTQQWRDVFRNSIDIKHILGSRLKRYSLHALFNNEERLGRLPTFSMFVSSPELNQGKYRFHLHIKNVSTNPAMNFVLFSQPETRNSPQSSCFEPGQAIVDRVVDVINSRDLERSGGLSSIRFILQYDLLAGVRAQDVFETRFLLPERRLLETKLIAREFVGPATFSVT